MGFCEENLCQSLLKGVVSVYASGISDYRHVEACLPYERHGEDKGYSLATVHVMGTQSFKQIPLDLRGFNHTNHSKILQTWRKLLGLVRRHAGHLLSGPHLHVECAERLFLQRQMERRNVPFIIYCPPPPPPLPQTVALHHA